MSNFIVLTITHHLAKKKNKIVNTYTDSHQPAFAAVANYNMLQTQRGVLKPLASLFKWPTGIGIVEYYVCPNKWQFKRYGAEEMMAQWLRAYSFERPGLYSQHPHDGTQLSVTPFSGMWCCLLASTGTAHIWYTDMYIGKISVHLK